MSLFQPYHPSPGREVVLQAIFPSVQYPGPGGTVDHMSRKSIESQSIFLTSVKSVLNSLGSVDKHRYPAEWARLNNLIDRYNSAKGI
jgi:hypothetical protein